MSIQVAGLFIYPIKSCGGISLSRSDISQAGLKYDRNWMVVDAAGRFLTQRSHPRLALVRTELKLGELIVRAPGMLRLDILCDVIEDDDSVKRRVTVWRDEVDAVDEGDLAAHWFSAFLGEPCRLVKIHPDARRVADRARVDAWLAAHPDAEGYAQDNVFAFADGFPVLVTTQPSLDALNAQLRDGGNAPVGHDRFRPNVVLSGDLEAFDEDVTAELRIGEIGLALVKRCTRCEVPNTDQHTAERGTEPMATMAMFRAQPEGGIIFGMNATVRAPAGAVLRVGDAVEAELDF